MNTHLPQKLTESVETKIRNLTHKRFTVSDIASMTGNDIADSKQIADELMQKYHCRLVLTEANSLIYDFGENLTLRQPKTFVEKWRTFRKKSIKGLKKGAWLGIQGIFVLHFFASPIYLIIWLATANKDPNAPKRKGFIQSLKDYVFGLESKKQTDNFSDEQEIASFLRQNKGLLTVSDIIILSGKTRKEAEEFMTECLIRFEGEAEISEKGVLYGNFDKLRKGVNKEGDKVPVPIWEEDIPELKFTGNSKRRNFFFTWIVGQSWFANLVVINTLIFGGMSVEMMGIMFPIYAGSLTLSTLFLGIPLYRLINWKKTKKLNQIQRFRAKILEEIFETPHRLTAEEIKHNVWNKLALNKLENKPLLDETLDNVLHDLGANPEVSDDGNVYLHFDKIDDELLGVNYLRSERQRFEDEGTVFLEVEN